MTRVRAALLAAAIALAACGDEPQQQSAASEPAPAVAPAAAQPEPAADIAAGPAIPERFLGVWDADTGSCDPASDLRLEIGPQTIGFYESQGTVTAVAENKDGSAVIALAMEGEGDKWEQTIKLELIGSGDAERLLSLPDPESDITLRPIRLKRCPA